MNNNEEVVDRKAQSRRFLDSFCGRENNETRAVFDDLQDVFADVARSLLIDGSHDSIHVCRYVTEYGER